MKTNVRILRKMHFVNGRYSSINSRFHTNAAKTIKRICFLFMFTGMAAIFNSCAVGWVATEPSYGVEIERPARPGDNYIWIEGGWRWDSGRDSYEREPGYWARPRPNHSYVPGHWESGSRGKSWQKGHWERKHRRDDNHDKKMYRDNKER